MKAAFQLALNLETTDSANCPIEKILVLWELSEVLWVNHDPDHWITTTPRNRVGSVTTALVVRNKGLIPLIVPVSVEVEFPNLIPMSAPFR